MKFFELSHISHFTLGKSLKSNLDFLGRIYFELSLGVMKSCEITFREVLASKYNKNIAKLLNFLYFFWSEFREINCS